MFRVQAVREICYRMCIKCGVRRPQESSQLLIKSPLPLFKRFSFRGYRSPTTVWSNDKLSFALDGPAHKVRLHILPVTWRLSKALARRYFLSTISGPEQAPGLTRTPRVTWISPVLPRPSASAIQPRHAQLPHARQKHCLPTCWFRAAFLRIVRFCYLD